jgi:hypothetical protein
MVTWDSGLGLWIGRLSRPRRGVRVLAMQDARLDPTRRVESACEVPPGACMLRLLVPGMVVGGIIDHPCVADRVTVTC